MSGSGAVRVALAGCGVVGTDLVRAIRASGPHITVVRVLVRRPERPREVELGPGVLTADLDSFMATEADVVVEAIGGLDPAQRIAHAALRRGIPFVTANKALIAASGEDLVHLGNAHDAGLFFEAAVASGVPIVRVVRDYLGRGAVRRIRGILNGTCNFVLTQLERGATLASAVSDAQRLGFAEADPARDLDGTDAADKIAVLAWLAFGTPGHALRVERRGLLPDGERLVRGVGAAGARLRLIAECDATNGQVSASVAPVVVAADSPFGRTVGEENRITVDTGWAWPIELAGPGAGGVPTAAALLADILDSTTTRSFSTRASTPVCHNGAADTHAHSWLLGVRAGAAREARVTLESARLAALPIGATAGDAWIHVEAAAGPAFHEVLQSLERIGARPAAARIDDPDRTALARQPRAAPARAAVAVGG